MPQGSIFYSQVKERIQREILARSRAGKTDRSTQSLNYMLGNIANVELTAYKTSDINDNNNILKTLGGKNVLNPEFFPGGPDGFLSKPGKRIPPYLTAIDVNIGDDSFAQLNRASVRISIPDPLQDLDFIETTFFRPGRHVTIKIEYPKTALLTQPDEEAEQRELKESKLYDPDTEYAFPPIGDPDYPRIYDFHGIITSFDFSYQPNGTIDGTLSITGTSNTYTDISMLIASNGAQTWAERSLDRSLVNLDLEGVNSPGPSGPPTETQYFSGPTTNVDYTNSITANETNTANPENSITSNIDNTQVTAPVNTFFQKFSEDFDKLIRSIDPVKDETNKRRNIERETKQYKINDNKAIFNEPSRIRWGKLYNETIDKKQKLNSESGFYRHVTLAYVINFINHYIMKKMKNVTDAPFIICTDEDELCQSTYYENITSADPTRILLAGKNMNGLVNTYGPIETDAEQINSLIVGFVEESTFPGYQEDSKAFPSRIFISLDVISDISKKLSPTITATGKNKTFRIKDFLGEISKEISKQTGGAVNLKLITHPTFTNRLLFYDKNRVDLTTNVEPFEIPMWANNPNGTIVQDFKITTKIPDNVKNLAYVLNQGADEVADSELAPYLNVMYTDDDDTKAKLQQRYRILYQDRLNKLNSAKADFANDPLSIERVNSLQAALVKHLEYPTDDIKNTNQLTAPIFPYEVEFTVPGINGFRYGDVLQFPGIPTRYKEGHVFVIIRIVHTVDSAGTWTTKFNCIMRPKVS